MHYVGCIVSSNYSHVRNKVPIDTCLVWGHSTRDTSLKLLVFNFDSESHSLYRPG